jgi:hypothetical protein
MCRHNWDCKHILCMAMALMFLDLHFLHLKSLLRLHQPSPSGSTPRLQPHPRIACPCEHEPYSFPPTIPAPTAHAPCSRPSAECILPAYYQPWPVWVAHVFPSLLSSWVLSLQCLGCCLSPTFPVVFPRCLACLVGWSCTVTVLASSVRCEKLLNACVWIHANVRVGVRLIQCLTFVKTSVQRVALLIYSVATTALLALFLLFTPTV